MNKHLSKILFGCAAAVAIGAVAVGGNGFLTAKAMAATSNQALPVVTPDRVSGQASEIIPASNGQAIVKPGANGQPAFVSKSAKPTFVAGTPGKNDLSREKAIEIARNAIIKKYALSDRTLSRFTVDAILNVVNPDKPEWHISFLPTKQADFSEIGDYFVTINSPSGNVVKLLSAADGVG